MPQTTATVLSVTINGELYQQASSVASDTLGPIATPTVPAAKTGTLTTRTDNDTGTFTMTTGHGFLTNDKIDVFWTGGSRRTMTATVTGDSVVLDGGTGDVLPSATTAITAMKPTSVPMVLTGDNVDALAVACPTAVSGWVVFKASGTVVVGYQLPAGAKAKVWASNMGITNPLAGASVTTVEFSHGSTSAQEMTAAIVY